MLSTHRLVQLHDLADRFVAKAKSYQRCACGLQRIGSSRGANHLNNKGQRLLRLAELAARRIRSTCLDDAAGVQRQA